jgi:hypothetical protein
MNRRLMYEATYRALRSAQSNPWPGWGVLVPPGYEPGTVFAAHESFDARHTLLNCQVFKARAWERWTIARSRPAARMF